jgi:hypothetical protein
VEGRGMRIGQINQRDGKGIQEKEVKEIKVVKGDIYSERLSLHMH